MSCSHTYYIPGRFVSNPDYNPDEWENNGWDLGPELYEPGHEESTLVDVDLHRYKCTQCGKIFYY